MSCSCLSRLLQHAWQGSGSILYPTHRASSMMRLQEIQNCIFQKKKKKVNLQLEETVRNPELHLPVTLSLSLLLVLLSSQHYYTYLTDAFTQNLHALLAGELDDLVTVIVGALPQWEVVGPPPQVVLTVHIPASPNQASQHTNLKKLHEHAHAHMCFVYY